MYEKLSISEEQIRACLQDQYGLSATVLEFLPLGMDTRSAVYRAESEQGATYLLKVRSGSFYVPSCDVPRYLRDQGIATIVAPLLTTSNALWTQVGDWTMTLYPFIAGNVGWTPSMTAEQWRAVGTTLHQIHQLRLPPGGFAGLRQETFDTTEYSRLVRMLDSGLAAARGESQVEQALRSCWVTHQTTIHAAVASLAALAEVLQGQSGAPVICHADLHPGNLIRGEAGNVFVIDWEDVMLAPKERDFLFVEDAPVEAATRQDIASFFQGYGQTEIDWIALTYYLWERAVQDLIACAQIVLYRADMGEATKADELRVFRDTLAEGGMVDIARAAAVHLPSDLRSHIEDIAR